MVEYDSSSSSSGSSSSNSSIQAAGSQEGGTRERVRERECIYENRERRKKGRRGKKQARMEVKGKKKRRSTGFCGSFIVI